MNTVDKRSLYLIDYHGEYKLDLGCPGIKLRHKLSSMYLQDALDALKSVGRLKTEEDTHDLTEKVMELLVKEDPHTRSMYTDRDLYYGDIYLVLYDSPEALAEFFKAHMGIITERVNSLGGDDDTFDYFPGYCETVAKLAEYVGPEAIETYNTWVDSVDQDEIFYGEPCLYKIMPK